MSSFWSKLGNRDDPFANKFGQLLDKGGIYKVNWGTEDIQIQMHYQDRVNMEAIKISAPINKKNYRQEKHYRAIENPLYNYEIQNIPDGLLEKWKAQLTGKGDFQKFSLLQAIHFFVSQETLSELLRTELFPSFFDWFPEGKILLLSTEPKMNKMLSALRMMGGTDKISQRDLSQAQDIKFANLLSGAQPSGIFQPARYLSIIPALFLPRQFGFLTHRLTEGILYCFESFLDDTRTPFPKNGMEFYRAHASNLFKDSKKPNHPTDDFALIQSDFSLSDWVFFFKQFVKHLNSFFRTLMNPVHFVESDNLTWAGLQQYLVWLTIERISNEIILMLTEEHDYLRKLALFRILDQIAYLGHKDPRQQVNAFNNFIVPDDQINDSVTIGLSKYNGVIAKYLQEELVNVRSLLVQEVSNSVFIKSFFDDNSREILVPDSKGMNALGVNEYTRKVVREIRNTAHGYSSNNYLIINKGHLPDRLPLLGVITFLALLATPDDFLRRYWD